MSGFGKLSARLQRLDESSRGALEQRFTSQLPRELDWTTTDLLRSTVEIMLYGAAHPGMDAEQLGAVMPTARDDEQEVGP